MHPVPFTHIVKFSSMKQRFLSRPAHSCTPMIPKIKKTKKQRRRTFPSMGRVSKSKFTRIRMPARGIRDARGVDHSIGVGVRREGSQNRRNRRRKEKVLY